MYVLKRTRWGTLESRGPDNRSLRYCGPLYNNNHIEENHYSEEMISKKKKAQQCENVSLRGIKRCKQTHQCAEYFSQMKPRQSYQSMGSLAADKPLQLERSLALLSCIWSIVLWNKKNPSPLHCWTSCICVSSQPGHEHRHSIQRCMHYLWKEMDKVFSSESLLKGWAHCISFSINGPCSSITSTPNQLHSFSAQASPAESELLHMHRTQYIWTYLHGGSSRA